MDVIRRIADEDAILSIDFLAGFTIFILALIMVISLVPGVLAGIQSENIDYDAVAYRTSVILVEDPGAPDNPSWGLMSPYDMQHKDEIQRLGLAVSKETPNILSREKVDKFFNLDPDSDFVFYAEDYRDKVIFGDFTYLYNISLATGGDVYYAGGGDPVPTFQYGYMRRLVKVKEPSAADICFNNYSQYTGDLAASENSTSEEFVVHIPYGTLINRTVNPAYRIDPQSEQLSVTLENMWSHLNETDIEWMNFEDMGLYIGGSSDPIPGLYPWANSTYSLTLNGNPRRATGVSSAVDNSSVITLELYPPLPFSKDITTDLNVNFNFSYKFKDSNVTHQYLSGMHQYDYTANVTQPDLVDGVMEVAIW
ncbi:DUF7287 family protein [Methanogenium organophilum]|uniref:Uncharacterized protein n=1 Tax=Methanogenium organophilum TaxID=2199 RepID=A0A9X9T7S8_METOG|nr:hypothetical protein [Methanogenium organophilum]WAI00417.1 hypothetical protein OU421_08230 [Methanogenium organophilum]